MRLKCFFFLSFFVFFTSCSVLQQKLSTEQDAKMAYNQALPNISSTSFSDILALRSLLKDQLLQYEVGVGFLKKQADLFKGSEKNPHSRRIIKIEMTINILTAKVDNLKLMYSEDWNTSKEMLHEEFKELHNSYKVAYEKLF